MLTPRVMEINMSKMTFCIFSIGSVFVFPPDDSKEIATVWAKYLRAPERSH